MKEGKREIEGEKERKREMSNERAITALDLVYTCTFPKLQALTRVCVFVIAIPVCATCVFRARLRELRCAHAEREEGGKAEGE